MNLKKHEKNRDELSSLTYITRPFSITITKKGGSSEKTETKLDSNTTFLNRHSARYRAATPAVTTVMLTNQCAFKIKREREIERSRD